MTTAELPTCAYYEAHVTWKHIRLNPNHNGQCQSVYRYGTRLTRANVVREQFCISVKGFGISIMIFFMAKKKMDEPSFFSVLYAKPNNLIAFTTFHINLLRIVAYPIVSQTREICPMWLLDNNIKDRYTYFYFILNRKTRTIDY